MGFTDFLFFFAVVSDKHSYLSLKGKRCGKFMSSSLKDPQSFVSILPWKDLVCGFCSMKSVDPVDR